MRALLLLSIACCLTVPSVAAAQRGPAPRATAVRSPRPSVWRHPVRAVRAAWTRRQATRAANDLGASRRRIEGLRHAVERAESAATAARWARPATLAQVGELEAASARAWAEYRSRWPGGDTAARGHEGGRMSRERREAIRIDGDLAAARARLSVLDRHIGADLVTARRQLERGRSLARDQETRLEHLRSSATAIQQGSSRPDAPPVARPRALRAEAKDLDRWLRDR